MRIIVISIAFVFLALSATWEIVRAEGLRRESRLPGIILLAIGMAFLVCSCATSRLFDPKTGNPLVVFQGDLIGAEYHLRADGSIDLIAANISHSTATKAQGEAASGVIGSAGAAIAVSGVAKIIPALLHR